MIPRRLLTATLSAAVGAMIAFGLSGCDFFVPQTTETTVETSDGVSGTIGQVHVGNAVLISGDGGQVSNLVVTFSNLDFVDHDVMIESTGAPLPVTVPAGGYVQVGTPGNRTILFVTTDSPPGSLHPIAFSVAGETLHLEVPVLDTSLPLYKHLGPPEGIGVADLENMK
ncbi:hypothetical protein ACPPVQ_17025 [Diaminobutyricibacter sp. McL0618]|uniref:hypothetical protein n=1 Tax=Leifsonia sp. McL0618 TaxID=3415677 RepID=UPI003CFBC00F